MIKVIHRANTISELEKIDVNYGVEIDLRNHENVIILSHDPGKNGESLSKYLNHYKHKLLIANIKEAGIEINVINELEKNNIKNFFLLDIEFPFLLNNHEKYGNYLSLRYSRYESIKTIENFIGKVEWVWIDTYSDFELNSEISNVLREFKICLVSPSRWNQNDKFDYYIKKLGDFKLNIDAIMIENNNITKSD